MRAAEPVPRPLSVTRNDVARYAGVSAAVVSYVVNSGPRRVAPDTRDRVLNAIRVLGYRPNTFARALKVGSTKTLGLVVPDISNPLFAEIARAVEEAAYDSGYALILANSPGGAEVEKQQLHNLGSRRVDGAIVVTPAARPDFSAMLDMNVPIVLINGITESEAIGSVGVDVFGGAQAGVDHLIEHGRTSIGLVMGDNGLRGTLDRHRGWLQSLQRAGLPEGPIVPVQFSREGGYVAGQRLLSSAGAPTAVFISSDLQAVGVLRAFHEAGVRVPDDIALVSFDGSLESQYTWPSLTVVRQPIAALAQHALAMLLDRSQEPQHLLVPGELIVRRSCGCTPAQP